MKKFHIDAKVFEKVVDLADMLSGTDDLMNDTITNLHRAVANAEGGWVVVYGEPIRKEQVKWTQEEENYFIARIRVYQNWGGWGQHGQMIRMWTELSEDMSRKVTSLKSKYAQLIRKGLITDVRVDG